MDIITIRFQENIIIHIRGIIIHIIHIRFLNISLEKLRSIRIIRF